MRPLLGSTFVALPSFIAAPLFNSGCSGPGVPAKFRRGLDSLIAESSRLDALTEQGVSKQKFGDQLAKVVATFDVASSHWPADYMPHARSEFQSGIDGWRLALRVGNLRIRPAGTFHSRFKPTITHVTGKRFGRLVATSEPDRVAYRSDEHNGPYVNCRCDCGNTTKKRLYPLLRGTVKSCGCYQKECAIQAVLSIPRKRPSGKPRIRKDGYRLIYLPDHPRATQRGYVLEHILVMEEKVGRELLPRETVHHVNGVRADNRPVNLELWDSKHCAGQRHIEKMAFHVQEIVIKASDEELAAILKAIHKRVHQRPSRGGHSMRAA